MACHDLQTYQDKGTDGHRWAHSKQRGAPFIDPMQFHSAYVICSLCGEDPESDAVELFRTHNATLMEKKRNL